MIAKDDVLALVAENAPGTTTLADVRRRFPELSEIAARNHLRRLWRAGFIDPTRAAALGDARWQLTDRGRKRLDFLRDGPGRGGVIEFV